MRITIEERNENKGRSKKRNNGRKLTGESAKRETRSSGNN
jgi:hypothetical protein